MSEKEPPLRRVDVEVSPFTDEFDYTWMAIHHANQVLELANRAIKSAGIELVTTWRGHYMADEEVRALVDDKGVRREPGPIPGRERIPMTIAADASLAARFEELQAVGNLVAMGRVITTAEVKVFLEHRRIRAKNLARDPQGGGPFDGEPRPTE